MALGALNVFYLHKMYFWSHMNSLYEINFTLVLQNLFPRMVSAAKWGPEWGHCSEVSMIKIYRNHQLMFYTKNRDE